MPMHWYFEDNKLHYIQIHYFFPMLKGTCSTTRLQNIMGVLKRNKVIVMWNGSLMMANYEIVDSLP